MENEVVSTRTQKIWLGEDGIIRCVALFTPTHTLADAKENVAITLKLAQGKKRPLLIDIRQAKFVDRESRAYYAGPENAKVALAAAFLIASPLSKMIGNFFLRLNKTRFPTRLFTSEAEAIEWLKGFGDAMAA